MPLRSRRDGNGSGERRQTPRASRRDGGTRRAENLCARTRTWPVGCREGEGGEEEGRPKRFGRVGPTPRGDGGEREGRDALAAPDGAPRPPRPASRPARWSRWLVQRRNSRRRARGAPRARGPRRPPRLALGRTAKAAAKRARPPSRRSPERDGTRGREPRNDASRGRRSRAQQTRRDDLGGRGARRSACEARRANAARPTSTWERPSGARARARTSGQRRRRDDGETLACARTRRGVFSASLLHRTPRWRGARAAPVPSGPLAGAPAPSYAPPVCAPPPRSL